MAIHENVVHESSFANDDMDTLEFRALISQAQASADADSKLTVRQALKKHKKAVFWAMILSTSLIMEGYDLVIVSVSLESLSSSCVHADLLSQINSFYGQPQFQKRFGVQVGPDKWAIPAAWQSGLSNSAVVGQLFGLVLNMEFQDRFGSRKTMMFFMVWLIGAIFIPFFAPSLPVLAVGEALCGIPWGVFQVR